MQETAAFLQNVLDSLTAEIAVLDQHGVVLQVNDAWRRRSLEHAQSADQTLPDVGPGANYLVASQAIVVNPPTSSHETVADGIRAVLSGRLPRFSHEYLHSARGRQRWWSMCVTPLAGGGSPGAVVSLEDISERAQIEKQVRDMAFYDPLTHLPNRRLLMERLSQQMARARRNQTRLALLFIDLDKFKTINDELGHEVGDWLLLSVGQRIQACLRESDTAARLGGDEFVVLLPDLPNSAAAMIVAEKIRQALALEYVTSQGVVLNTSSSIGVALYPDHGATEKELLRLGDEAMYLAKKSGRNTVHLCVSTLSESAPETLHSAPLSYVHLRWKDVFRCGNPVIDEEHETLFLLANALLDQVALRGQQPQAFEAAFEKLLTHVEIHFAHEEAIFQACGYANQAEHAQQHQALLTQARRLHRQATEAFADGAIEAKLIKFLVFELVAGHMLHTDREFFTLFATP